ncbi:G protein-regulated inducer of neurite outgrowth 1 [Antechinus flavipes]|uniref:G protein-regulated inducer of neurite outgrowth 1 n=1 Tax=Antechinus flavipes TaxID=38775 RepID=UPI002235821F|nr:G protein-regulated inducer of neurite outgrowth 1 [Antechinus flavipes]
MGSTKETASLQLLPQEPGPHLPQVAQSASLCDHVRSCQTTDLAMRNCCVSELSLPSEAASSEPQDQPKTEASEVSLGPGHPSELEKLASGSEKHLPLSPKELGPSGSSLICSSDSKCPSPSPTWTTSRKEESGKEASLGLPEEPPPKETVIEPSGPLSVSASGKPDPLSCEKKDPTPLGKISSVTLENMDCMSSEKNDPASVRMKDSLSSGTSDPVLLRKDSHMSLEKGDPVASGKMDLLTQGKAYSMSVGKMDPISLEKADPSPSEKANSVSSGKTDPMVIGKMDSLPLEKEVAIVSEMADTVSKGKVQPGSLGKEDSTSRGNVDPVPLSKADPVSAGTVDSVASGKANSTSLRKVDPKPLGKEDAIASGKATSVSAGKVHPGSPGKEDSPGQIDSVPLGKANSTSSGEESLMSLGKVDLVSLGKAESISPEKVNPVSVRNVDPISLGKIDSFSSEKTKLIASEKMEPVLSGKTDHIPLGKTDPLSLKKEDPISVSLGKLTHVSSDKGEPISLGKTDSVSLRKVDPVSSDKIDPMSLGKINPASSGKTDPRPLEKVDPVPLQKAELTSPKKEDPMSSEKLNPLPLKVDPKPLGKASPTSMKELDAASFGKADLVSSKKSPTSKELLPENSSQNLASPKPETMPSSSDSQTWNKEMAICGTPQATHADFSHKAATALFVTGHGTPSMQVPGTQPTTEESQKTVSVPPSQGWSLGCSPQSDLQKMNPAGPAGTGAEGIPLSPEGIQELPGAPQKAVDPTPVREVRTRDNFTKVPSWDVSIPQQDAGTQADTRAACVSVAVSPMTPQDGSGPTTFSFQPTAQNAPASRSPGLLLSKKDVEMQVSMGVETRSVATGPMTPVTTSPQASYPEVQVRATEEAPEPVREVSWDEKGMTWEVYGASMEVEVLGMAIQKHLEKQIEEHGRQGGPSGPQLPGTRAGSLRGGPRPGEAKRPPSLFRSLLQSMRRPRCCSRAGPTAE